MTKPLPRIWKRRAWPAIVDEADLRLTPRSRLRAKLLIFDSCAGLNRFWRDVLGRGSLGRHCRGAVNSLTRWKERYDPVREKWDRRMVEADPRYFCVVGLVRSRLTTEIVMHESVHIGFCHAKRVRRTPWAEFADFDEEQIAYPAGRAARLVTNFLYKRGYWK